MTAESSEQAPRTARQAPARSGHWMMLAAKQARDVVLAKRIERARELALAGERDSRPDVAWLQER